MTQELSGNNDMSRTDDRVRHSSIAGVSISKVKMDSLARSVANPGIKPPNRRPEEEKEDLLGVKLGTDENVKVSRIKSAAKQKIPTFGVEFPEQHLEKSFEKTRPRHQSSGAEYGFRVTRVRSKLPTVDYQSSMNNPCPSIIGNTIHLDSYDGIKPTLNTPKIDRARPNAHYVQSRPLQMKITEHCPSQIDTIEMSPVTTATNQNQKTSPSVVHIKRIRTIQKKISGESVTAPFQSIVEET